jgi:lipoprotein-releasing system permease protein
VRLPYELHVALRYLVFHRGRAFLSVITLISIAGVTVGTAALVIALSLMTGFERDLRERILRGRAHLHVTSKLEFPFAGAEEATAHLRAAPGVDAVGPVLYTPAMLTIGGGGGSPAYSEIHGVDPEPHARIIRQPGVSVEPFQALTRPTESGRRGIVLGRELARRLAAGVGDTVRVIVPKVHLTPVGVAPRSYSYEVVGIYTSDYFLEDAERAFVTLDSARRILRAADRAHWLELRLTDFDDIQEMKPLLRAHMGETYEVVDLIEENKDLIRALNVEKLALFSAIALIVVVASLNIVSTLILMVTDKVKEIGTLSALGARPLGVALVFVFQGLVIGLIGTTLGLTAGAGISLWLDAEQVIQLNPDVYYLSYVPFKLQPTGLVIVGVVAMFISLAATIYPSIKAATLDPVEALRYE